MNDQHWIELSQDADTGIESIRAHFQGHAYDPHWHDSYLVGVTEQGVQQFNCRRMKHLSTPGKVFMLESLGRSTTAMRRPRKASPTRCCISIRIGWSANCAACSSMRRPARSWASPTP